MIILCYHELADDEATPWRLKRDTFVAHLDALAGKTVGRLTDPTTDVAITFDDGCSGCFDAARLMRDRGYVGYFYVCPGFIDQTVSPHWPTNYLTWEQIDEMSADHIIGAHSMTHPRKFLMLSPEQQRVEMAESKRIIEEQTGKPCLHWATPHGYWTSYIASLAKELGFETVVTTKQGPNCPLHPFFLQRFEIHRPCPVDEFQQILEAAW